MNELSVGRRDSRYCVDRTLEDEIHPVLTSR